MSEIVKELGVTKDVADQNYFAMKNSGVIKGATVQIDFTCLGYDTLATLLIFVDAHQAVQIMRKNQ
jgi:hypothetical protein